MRDKYTAIRQAYERALQRHAEWPTFRFEDAEHALDTVNAIAAKMHTVTLRPIQRGRPKTSRFIGVKRNRGRWAAMARVDGAVVHIGSFGTEEEAARAYDAYVKAHGLNKPLNFGEVKNDTEAA